MSKVVLICPNSAGPERIENEGAWPPLGLVYIGTLLERSGHEVRIIDNARKQLPDGELINRVKSEDPDIVGISALSPTFRRAIKLASELKKECPSSKIVLGNYHATFEYERILRKCDFIDFVVIGEGEMTMIDLTEALDKGGEIKDVKGIAFRKNGDVFRTEHRPPIKDLDGLPFPNRELLEEGYFSEVIDVRTSSGKFTTMVTSRGCPFGCRYCACSSFTSRTVRLRSPENVVDEMEMLQSDGYEEIGIVDDNFLIERKRVERICDLIRERKIKIDMWLEGRGDQASLSTLKKLAKAGCRAIYFGIESGNEHVLKYYGKNIKPDICRKAVSNAKKAGIDAVIGSFIVGAPIEKKVDVENTFRFAMSLKDMDFPQMNILYLSPGMELWRDAVSRGYLDEDAFWDAPVPAVNVYPSHIELEDLEKMVGEFYDGFIRRRSYIALQVLKTLKSRWRLKILMKNLGLERLRDAFKHLKGD